MFLSQLLFFLQLFSPTMVPYLVCLWFLLQQFRPLQALSMSAQDSTSSLRTNSSTPISSQHPVSGAARLSNSAAISHRPTALETDSFSSAYVCNSMKRRWLDNYNDEYEVHWHVTRTYTTTITVTDTEYNYYTLTSTSLRNRTEYTLCDELPRLDGTTSVSSRRNTTTYVYSFEQETTAGTTVTTTHTPSPTCSIPSSLCAELTTTWLSSFTAYSIAWANTSIGYGVVVTGGAGAPLTAMVGRQEPATSHTITSKPRYPSWGPPVCGNYSKGYTQISVGVPQCFAAQASVNLLYWPVVRFPGNLCKGNWSTKIMSETIPGQPNTVVTLNTTLTSPTNYIQLIGKWGYETGGTSYAQQTRVLVPRLPSAISSYCANFNGGHGPPQSINYANFDYPVPASAYTCQPKCYSRIVSYSMITTTLSQAGSSLGDGETQFGVTKTFPRQIYSTLPAENLCSTIYDDYAPALSVPDELHSLTLVSELQPGISCTFMVHEDNLFFDPPTALVPAASAALPTTPNQASQAATTTSTSVAKSASPASTVSPSTAAVTAGPSPSVTADPGIETKLPPTTSTTSGSLRSGPKGASTEPESSASTPITSARPAADPASGSAPPVQSGNTGASRISQPPGTATLPSSKQASATAAQAGIGGVIASIIGLTATAGSGTTPGQDSGPSAGRIPAAAATTIAKSKSSLADASQAESAIVSSDPSGGLPTAAQSNDTAATSAAPMSIDHGATAGSSIGYPGQVPSGYGSYIAVPTTSPSTSTIASTTPVADSSSGGAAGSGVILSPGGPAITEPGTEPSLSTSASYLVVDGSTQSPAAFAQGPSAAQPSKPVPTAAGQTTTAESSSATAGDPKVTLFAGGSAVTISGTVLSLGSSASFLVVDGTTQTPLDAQPTSRTVVTVGGQTLTKESGHTAFTLGNGAILSLVGAATVSGQMVSLAHGASYYVVVDGSSTQMMASVEAPSATGKLLLTLGSTTLTANSQSAFDFGASATLQPGAVITISGTTISLDSQATEVVVNGVTQTLAAANYSAADRGTISTTSATRALPSVVTAASQSSSSSPAPSSAARPRYGTRLWLSVGLAAAMILR